MPESSQVATPSATALASVLTTKFFMAGIVADSWRPGESEGSAG
jgi:hypothetical protein